MRFHSPEEPDEPSSPQLATIDPARMAFFFDLDGTLAAIVDHPDNARVEPTVTSALASLAEAAAGALAIVSGRSLDHIDKMLHPLRLPAAGVHGLERRTAEGAVERAPVDEVSMGRLQDAVAAFVGGHPGLFREVKPGSVALHYRKRPELEREVLQLAVRLSASDPRISLVRGKKVVEMKLAARTKADAIAAFMDEPPFSGRRPLFAGDDITDEDGFAVLARWAGISVKIGQGETAASHRFADISKFHEWLGALARQSQHEGDEHG